MWQFYFNQKVEIATLPLVARNDRALLDVTAHQQIARDNVVFHRDWDATKQMQ